MTDTIAAPVLAAQAGLVLPEDLRRWRDAAESGQLPEPARADRWQQLRAGVVNMWEFEVAEYWTADGRCQLMGRNETGKSSLMTLTTLIMIAADTSPHYIDTLGDGGKRFRYYVEPTGNEKDRRDASRTVNRGWTWVEYGRQTPDGPRYVTALLYAETNRAKTGERPKLAWCMCEGPARVRSGIDLLKSSAAVPAADLADLEGWQQFKTAEAYRDRLARVVFDGSEANIDAVVRMLRVIRTPKLGEKLNLAFLSEQIRMAFPPLQDREIYQLADGWDQLAKIAEDRDNAQQAQEALHGFVRRPWSNWARAVVRRTADTLTAANSAVDDIARKKKSHEGSLDGAVRALADLDRLDGADRRVAGALGAEQDEIRKSQLYRDAEGAQERAVHLSQEADRLAGEAGAQDGTATGAETDAEIGENDATQQAAAVEQHTAAIGRLAASAAKAAASAGIAKVGCDAITSGDAVRADAAVKGRRETLRHLRSLIGALSDVQQRAQSAAETLGLRAGEDDEAAEYLEGEIDKAQDERQRLTDEIGAWAVTTPAPHPTGEDLQAWTEAVAALDMQETPLPALTDLIQTGYLNPRRTALTTAQARAEESHRTLTQQAGGLAQQIDTLNSSVDVPPPGPTAWNRRERPQNPGPDGAPLWRLLDPVDGLPAATLNPVEAALAAAGLLDAWISPDGSWRAGRDGADTVVAAAPARDDGPTLSAVLTPASDAADLAGAASAFLESVAWRPDGVLPDCGTGIAADGRWRTDTAAGLAPAAAGGAGHIGTAARAASRARQVAEFEQRREKLLDQAEQHRGEAQAAKDALARLQTAADVAPSDLALVLLLNSIRQARLRRSVTAAARATARKALEDIEPEVDKARAAIAVWRDDHGLPQTPEQLDELGRDLEALGDRLAALHRNRADLAAETKLAGRAAEAAARERARADKERRKADALREVAEETRVKARTARDALTTDAQALLDRVVAIDVRLGELRDAAGARSGSRAMHTDSQRRAELALEGITAEHDDAVARRTSAAAAWWHTFDSGLPEALGITAPDTRTLTAALEAARGARSAAVQPPDWPERDADAQQARIDRAWRKLVEDHTVLRSTLEALGGRSTSIVEGDDDTALPAIEAVIDTSGIRYSLHEALVRLGRQHEDLKAGYDRAWHDTLNRLLGSTFIEHLRDRLAAVHALERSINDTLAVHPTQTSRTSLRIRREPLESDPHGSGVLEALSQDYALLTAEAQEQVQNFLRARVDEAQEQAKALGESDWRPRLSKALDYRAWFNVVIDNRSGAGRWTPMSRGGHEEHSGGARVVTLILPLIAALAAMYQSTPTGPRPLWLDEAFDGLDGPNRSSVLSLLNDFDMDFLLAGPGPLVNTATVPAAAIYEVVRAPNPMPGADLTLMLWAGGRMTAVELPDPAELAARAAAQTAAKAAEDIPDLFSQTDGAHD